MGNNFCAGHGDRRIKCNINIYISEMKINSVAINSRLKQLALGEMVESHDRQNSFHLC